MGKVGGQGQASAQQEGRNSSSLPMVASAVLGGGQADAGGLIPRGPGNRRGSRGRGSPGRSGAGEAHGGEGGLARGVAGECRAGDDKAARGS